MALCSIAAGCDVMLTSKYPGVMSLQALALIKCVSDKLTAVNANCLVYLLNVRCMLHPVARAGH